MFKSGEATVIIDPFNKFNIYSFPLLTSYSAFVILLKAYSFNDVNSGKLYILDLLKAGADLGGGCRGCAPPPPEMNLSSYSLLKFVYLTGQ